MIPRALERLAEPGAARPATMPYAPLIGGWDIVWRQLDDGGRTTGETPGEWHFATVLGGYGVQDVIRPAGAGPELAGTTLRCWDGAAGVWRAVFMSPGDGEFVTLTAEPSDDGIHQRVVDPVEPGERREWNFSEIRRESFLWQARVSSDGGAGWCVTHEIRAHRQA